jgi:hypothetical protein
MAASSSRASRLASVWLDLADDQARALAARVAGADDLTSALVTQRPARLWATSSELATTTQWLEDAAAVLDQPPLRSALHTETHELTAQWRWPDHPLVHVHLDSQTVAAVDYLPASATAHWHLRWLDDQVLRAHPANALAIMPLAGHVPEEADADSAMLAFVLDEAAAAVAAELTGRVVRLDFDDA